MWRLSELIRKPAEALAYQRRYEGLRDNARLQALHWSDERQQFADYGLHTERVKLARPPMPPGPPVQQQEGSRRQVRVTLKEPQLGFVPALGYVSLFPLLFSLLDASNPRLERVLLDLRNESHLWTRFGLRSLARSATLYNKYNTDQDPPYWRGTVWLNINYMALCALRHYAGDELAINRAAGRGNNEPPPAPPHDRSGFEAVNGPYAKLAASIYSELRANLVRNVFAEWQRTGFVWEQYSDTSGEGRGAHPFTGWSSLIVLVMAEIC